MRDKECSGSRIEELDMIKTVYPGAKYGTVTAPSSKSIAHRALICAALADRPSTIYCNGISNDIKATVSCLEGLGAGICIDGEAITVEPVRRTGNAGCEAVLKCGESGSTLRFLLPVAGALGKAAVFIMEGRLPERPMAEYEAVLSAHGMNITRNENMLYCSGKLDPGAYSLPGNISSQYFSGLLFALPLTGGESTILIEGNPESADYLALTEDAIGKAGISFGKTDSGYIIPGRQTYGSVGEYTVEGDYSGAAFYLCAGALSEKGITVKGLDKDSLQGDRRILDVLRRFGAYVEETDAGILVKKDAMKGISVDASVIPDLIPVLSITACAAEGSTVIYNGHRLRMKESDRIAGTVKLIRDLGGEAEELPDGMIIKGTGKLKGGKADPCKDHRIAMAGAVAAFISEGSVIVSDAECVDKSYAAFWEDLSSLSV